MNKPLILVVEDDPAVARLISTTLETLHLSRLGQKKFYFFLYIFYQTLTDF